MKLTKKSITRGRGAALLVRRSQIERIEIHAYLNKSMVLRPTETPELLANHGNAEFNRHALFII